MKAVVEHVAERYPTAPLFAVAFSAGGHILATYLSAVGKHTPLVGAVSVAGCFDFVRTYDFVEAVRPFTPQYTHTGISLLCNLSVDCLFYLTLALVFLDVLLATDSEQHVRAYPDSKHGQVQVSTCRE